MAPEGLGAVGFRPDAFSTEVGWRRYRAAECGRPLSVGRSRLGGFAWHSAVNVPFAKKTVNCCVKRKQNALGGIHVCGPLNRSPAPLEGRDMLHWVARPFFDQLNLQFCGECYLTLTHRGEP